MRIDVRSVLIKVPGLPAQGPYADEPPSPPSCPALEAGEGGSLEADRSPYDVAAQLEGEAAKGSEGLTTPPRRVSTTPATLSQGVQTSPIREDHPQEVSDQGTQTSPPNRQDLRRLTYDEGPISSRRDVEVSTPIVPCSEYLAGFELVTDTEDDEKERPLFRRSFVASPQQDQTTETIPSRAYVERSRPESGRNLWSTTREDGNPQRAPSCAHPGEPLTEWENQVLEQVLTDLSGVRFPEPTVDTVLRRAQPVTEASASPTSAAEVDRSAYTEDDLWPLPEGWIGGNNLRFLPRRVISQIESKLATRIGRGQDQ